MPSARMRLTDRVHVERSTTFPDGSTFVLWAAKDEGEKLRIEGQHADTPEEATRQAIAWLTVYPRGAVYILQPFAYVVREREPEGAP